MTQKQHTKQTQDENIEPTVEGYEEFNEGLQKAIHKDNVRENRDNSLARTAQRWQKYGKDRVYINHHKGKQMRMYTRGQTVKSPEHPSYTYDEFKETHKFLCAIGYLKVQQ